MCISITLIFLYNFTFWATAALQVPALLDT